MITVFAHADKSALLDAADTEADREAINEKYDAYAEYLESNGVSVDRDSNQTTYCNDGALPEGVEDFWSWYN